MAIDEDIAASLPKPPLPAPSRRDAAIGAAMARFDGAPAPAAPIREKPRFGRTQVGALVSAALVAFVGIPALWMSAEDPVRVTQRGAAPSSEFAADRIEADGPAAPAPADGNVEAAPVAPAETVAPEPAAKAEAAMPGQADADRAAPKEEEARAEIIVSANRHPSAASPAPVAVSGADMLAPQPRDVDIPAAQSMGHLAEDADNIVVTGAKVSRPAARARRAAERNDTAACTINDPGRDLSACHGLKGARGQAGAWIADGLSRAWRGDYDGAIADFDKAIAADPKSGIAYLNRGLAHRAKGDEAKAASDLRRARALGND